MGERVNFGWTIPLNTFSPDLPWPSTWARTWRCRRVGRTGSPCPLCHRWRHTVCLAGTGSLHTWSYSLPGFPADTCNTPLAPFTLFYSLSVTRKLLVTMVILMSLNSLQKKDFEIVSVPSLWPGWQSTAGAHPSSYEGSMSQSWPWKIPYLS